MILHHCLSHSARKYAVTGGAEWWGLMVLNRILHFAVPLFLLVSAVLFARSLARREKPDWARFFDRRIGRTVQPYLVWTGVYILFRLFVMRLEADLLPATLVLPFGLEATGPALLFDAERLGKDLLWGNGFFHLYFMAVLLQMALIFPIVYGILKRLGPSFGATVGVALGLQVACVLLQRSYGLLGTPASTALWYLPAIILGTWVGLNWDRWPQTWRAWRSPLAYSTAAGFAVYLGYSILLLNGAAVSSPIYNISFVLFSTGLALMLLAAAKALAASRAGKPLAFLGNLSIALFLVHPMVMYLLSGPRIGAVMTQLPFTPLFVVAAVFGLSYGIVLACVRLRVDGVLFGRVLMQPTAAEQAVTVEPVVVTAPAVISRRGAAEVFDPILDPRGDEESVTAPLG